MALRFDATRQLALVLLLAFPLAGCGGGNSAKPEAAKGIYTSSADCADHGKLTFEQCVTAMDQAVAEHESAAPTYSSLQRCEDAEGVNKCEHTHAGRFRPKLLAFFVVASEPPTATPLYAAPKGEAGFRNAGSKLFLEKDETITFSEHAQTLYEAQREKPRI